MFYCEIIKWELQETSFWLNKQLLLTTEWDSSQNALRIHAKVIELAKPKKTPKNYKLCIHILMYANLILSFVICICIELVYKIKTELIYTRKDTFLPT